MSVFHIYVDERPMHWLPVQTRSCHQLCTECSETQQFCSGSVEPAETGRIKKESRANTQREPSVLNREQLFVLPPLSYSQDVGRLRGSTGTKTEWKTVTGHLNLCGPTVESKQGFLNVEKTTAWPWNLPVLPLFWISQTTSPLNLGQLRTSSDVHVQQTIRARYQTEAPTLLK